MVKVFIPYLVRPGIIQLFLCLIFYFHFSECHAQSAWQENRFYAYKGGSDIICGNAYLVNKTDGIHWWTETWKDCRKRIWYQEYYSGFVYYWGPNGWYREWKEGYFWYFNWYDYPKRIG